MAKFSELTDKAENLIETGEIAKREMQQCASRVAVASSQLLAAQKQLEKAREKDEDGKPKGDVNSAQSAVAFAQGTLAASKRALQSAQNNVTSINAQKQAHIRKIEAHNMVEKNNLLQIKKLQGFAFSGNNEALYKGIVERMNSADRAKVSLKKSLGIEDEIQEEQLEEKFTGSSYENKFDFRYGANNKLHNSSFSNAGVGSRYAAITSVNLEGQSRDRSEYPQKVKLVSASGTVVDKKEIINKWNEAVSSGDVNCMNKYRTLYELNSFFEELDLTDGAENIIQEGGLYKDLKTHLGYERHHIPSCAVQEKNKNFLPAIAMTKEDHALTDSYRWKQNNKTTSLWGEEFKEYKIEASNKISDNEYIELVKAEIFNVVESTGHKYDGGIKAYFQSLYTMIEKDGVPQAHLFHKEKDAVTLVNDNSPMGKLTQYMNKNNYGINDYDIYSKDPEWKALHAAAFKDDYNDNYALDRTRLQNTHNGRIFSYSDKISCVMNEISAANNDINSLRAAEILNSIERFTGEEYELIRSAYLTRSDNSMKRHLDNIDYYIDNASKWDGKTYRGINVDRDTRDAILNDKIIDMKGPSSWSTSEHTARSYARKGSESEMMVFVLPKNISGASITNLATYGMMEYEVIEPSHIRYEIDKAVKADGYTYVYVHEK